MNQIDHLAYAAVIDDMHVRLARANADRQRLIHEAERHVCQPQRIFPVQVRCDRKNCVSVVAFDPEPAEDALALALAALGWAGHVCPRCQP